MVSQMLITVFLIVPIIEETKPLMLLQTELTTPLIALRTEETADFMAFQTVVITFLMAFITVEITLFIASHAVWIRLFIVWRIGDRNATMAFQISRIFEEMASIAREIRTCTAPKMVSNK